MISLILKLRLRQIVRELQALGPIYSLILLAGLVFLIRFAYLSVYSFQNISLLLVGWSAVLLTIHVKRKDRRFLSRLSFSSKYIFIVEYLMVSIPIIIIVGRCFPYLLIPFLVFVYLLALFKITKEKFKTTTKNYSFIPSQLFEWRAGIRSLSFYVFISIYLSSYVGLYFPYMSLVMCWILNSIICSFYQQTESRFMLRSMASNSKQLIIRRIFLAYKAQSILLVPIHILYAIIYTDQIIISLVAYLLFAIILIFCIISKYAFYEPNQSSGPSSIYLGLGQLSVFIPILIPLPILLSIAWYPKAIKKLNYYFHA